MTSRSRQPEASRYGGYAPYYDLLYENKGYRREARFVHEQLRAAGARTGSLLELGCGTGRHALALADLGWNVQGYDLSPGMITRARDRVRKRHRGRQPRFEVGDMRSLQLGQTFAAVISLFHAFCYQTSNRQVHAALDTVVRHLKPDGRFLFDFWYGPAVLADRPGLRVKRVENRRFAVTRISEPTMDLARNVVDVSFDIAVEDKRSRRVEHVQEDHQVRYFFLPEIEELLERHGLELQACGRWMTREPLDAASWYGWLVARRRRPGANPHSLP